MELTTQNPIVENKRVNQEKATVKNNNKLFFYIYIFFRFYKTKQKKEEVYIRVGGI